MRAGAAQDILGSVKPRPDRLRDVVDVVLEALDEGLDGRALAARAMLSPFHFHRLVRAGIGEAPAAFRRRLLLERAAWQLGRGASTTDAGFEAGYDAIEAFSRAFTRAHGVPPSQFAREPRDFRLAAPNDIHFHPPGGLLLPGQPRTTTMDLSDRLVEHEHWHTARLLEQAATLSDDALDRQVRPGLVVHDFEGPEPDLRTMLERIVFTKEVWTAAIGGRDIPSRHERSIAECKRGWQSCSRSSRRSSDASAIATNGMMSSSMRCARRQSASHSEA